MTETRPPTCRRTPTGRLLASHQRGCETPGCEGCEPCHAQHCACGRHLAAGQHPGASCARCLGRTRTTLTRLAELSRLIPVAAAESAGRNLLAVTMAGPIPEHTTATVRHAWAMRGALCRCVGHCPDLSPTPLGPVCQHADPADPKACSHHACRRLTYRPTCPGLVEWLEYADGPDAELHPLQVLGTWEIAVAEHLEHDRRDRITVAGAAAYLDVQLTYLAGDPGFAFDELDRELRDCLAHVERVLAVAPHTQRGAPCPVCRAAGRKPQPLVRHYADDRDVPAGQQPDDSRDWWVCPDPVCAQTWTVAQYERYVAGTYVDEADRLTAAQIFQRYRVPEGSVRRWAATGKVQRHGYDGHGRQLYDVAQVKAMRDTTAVPTLTPAAVAAVP